MVKRNMFKAFLVSLLCFGSFCGSGMNAASNPYEDSAISLRKCILDACAAGEIELFIKGFGLDKLEAVITSEMAKSGWFPLNLAAHYGRSDILKVLLAPFKDNLEALKRILMSLSEK